MNSPHVTDVSIAEVLKKHTQLKVLDIAGCPRICGICFPEALEHVVCADLQRLVLGPHFAGRAGKVAEDQLRPKCPSVRVEINERKKFVIQ